MILLLLAMVEIRPVLTSYDPMWHRNQFSYKFFRSRGGFKVWPFFGFFNSHASGVGSQFGGGGGLSMWRPFSLNLPYSDIFLNFWPRITLIRTYDFYFYVINYWNKIEDNNEKICSWFSFSLRENFSHRVSNQGCKSYVTARPGSAEIRAGTAGPARPNFISIRILKDVLKKIWT